MDYIHKEITDNEIVDNLAKIATESEPTILRIPYIDVGSFI